MFKFSHITCQCTLCAPVWQEDSEEGKEEDEHEAPEIDILNVNVFPPRGEEEGEGR